MLERSASIPEREGAGFRVTFFFFGILVYDRLWLAQPRQPRCKTDV